jgi:hypothetical protein
MLPDIAPAIAQALAQARLVTVHNGSENGDAASSTTESIASVIRTVLAAQIVTRSGFIETGEALSQKNDGDRVAAVTPNRTT